MEENYNNMVYGDQEFKTFAEIFNYGLSLCKWWKKKKAEDFFTAYSEDDLSAQGRQSQLRQAPVLRGEDPGRGSDLAGPAL